MRLLLKIFLLLFVSISICSAQNSINNKYRLARTYEQNGQLQKAKSMYEELNSAEPNNNQYSNALNSIYIKLKEYDNSIKFLQEKITRNPMDVSTHGMLGTTYYLQGNTEKAIESWDNGIKTNNKAIINYSIIANFAIQNRAFEPATVYLKEAKSKAPNPTQFSYQLAQIYSYSMDYANAAEEYCEVLKSYPKQLDYIKRRMQQYLSSPGGLNQSIDVAEKYQDNLTIQEFLIFLYTQNNQYEDAFSLVVKLDRDQNRNGILIYNFATDTYLKNEFSPSSDAYKYIIDNFPNSPLFRSSQIGYAKTLESKLYSSLKNNQGWKPVEAIDTSGSYKFSSVLEAYSELLTKINNTESVNEILFRTGSIKLDRFHDLNSAEEDFLKILRNSSLSQFYGIANLRLADISILSGNLAAAKNYLINSFSSIKTPEEVKSEAKYKLALIHFWNYEFDRSLNTISDINKDLSNDQANEAIELAMVINMGRRDSLNLVKFSQADLNTWQKNFAKAGPVFLQLSEQEGFFLLNNISMFRYAEILVAQDNYPIAIEILKTLSEKEKLNIFADKSLFLLAQVYEFGIADNAAANSIYEDILKYHPNSLYVQRARESITRLKTI